MITRNMFRTPVILLLAISFMGLVLMAPASTVFAEVGEDVDNIGPSEVTFGSILPIVTETGLITSSIDGLGSNASSGIIQVEKPAGATVRGAYMAAASRGFSQRKLVAGDVKIDGVGFPPLWRLPL